jgi:hypothetical protein
MEQIILLGSDFVEKMNYQSSQEEQKIFAFKECWVIGYILQAVLYSIISIDKKQGIL